MAVVRVLFRAEFRHRWRSWLLLALLVGLVSGLVLAGVAAGRRTATAFPRYVAAHGYDAMLYSAAPTPTIATLPEVALSTQALVPGNGAPRCAGCRQVGNQDFGLFDFGPQALRHQVKLVAGRMPDPSDPDEVLASFTLQRDFGVHLGSVIRVPFASPAQRSAVLSGANITPNGPTFFFKVVGFEAAEDEFPATNSTSYNLYTTPAFARAIQNRTVFFYVDFVRLRRGAADLPRFEAQAREAGGRGGVTDLDTTAATVSASIRPQAVGWWILAGLTALVGIIVVAQALARQAVVEGDTFATLGALGVSSPQLTLLGMARTLAVGTVGVASGVLLAYGLSTFTPVGEARLADPADGFSFDTWVLLLGALTALLIVLALGVWPAVGAARVQRADAVSRVSRPSRTIALLAGIGASPSALIGVRHALERGRGRTAVPVGSALVGSILAVTALCATAVFGASLTHLTTTPSLYGQPFDLFFSVNSTGTPAQADRMLHSIESQKGISDVTAGISGDVSIDGHTVNALAGQPIRGPLLLTTITGRLPGAADEVSLGSTTLRTLHGHLGSRVRVTVPDPQGGSRTGAYRVVGVTSFPPDFGTGGLGTGAVFDFAGLGAPCPPASTPQRCAVDQMYRAGGGVLVRAEPGAGGRSALDRLVRAYGDQVTYPAPPTDLVNFGQAVNFPLILGSVLIVFGVATLLHVLVVSVTRRRREVGLLKSLGFLRRQVAFTLAWQTTTVALVGIVVGVPAGVAVGRLVWRVFADHLGVVPVPVVAGWVIAAVALGTLVVANLLALGPALVAARSRPATLLRTE